MAHTALFEHVKLKQLISDLGHPRPHVVGYLECLSYYVATHNALGDISNMTDEQIELAAEWEGEPGRFITAAIARRFIDRDDAGTRLHDWLDWAPDWVKKRARRMLSERRTTAPNGAERRTVADNGALEKRRVRVREENTIPPTPLAGGVTAKPARFTAADIETIRLAYPRKDAPKAARKAIEKALREIADRLGAPANPVTWLRGVVDAYSKSSAGNAGKYTPMCATWINRGSYDDDPAEWSRAEQTPQSTEKAAADAAQAARVQQTEEYRRYLRGEVTA